VVAEAGTVGGRIVRAKGLERRTAAGRVEGARNDVNLRRMILAKLAVRIRAGGVEIAQSDRPDAVRALEVRQRVLDSQFRLAVRIDRSSRIGFADRRFERLSVNGAGRGKNEL